MWKSKLDEYLSHIPDHPVNENNISGLSDIYSAKSTNSLNMWIPFLGLGGRRDSKKMDHRYYSTMDSN